MDTQKAFISVGAGCQGLNLSMVHAFGLFLKLMSSAYDQVRGIILAVSYRVGIAMLWLRAGKSFSGRVFVISSHASPELQGISVGEPLKGSDLSGDNTDPDFIDKLLKKGQHKIGYRPEWRLLKTISKE